MLKTRAFKIALFSVLSAGILGYGQQCSRAKLEEYHEYSFSQHTSKNPLRLDPPSDFMPHRRYVLLVDMSNSMISGRCPQDVDGGMLIANNTPFVVRDPNKNAGNYNDHRGSGVDCQVNATLPITRASVQFNIPNLITIPPILFQTSFGVDPERDRITIIKKWITGALGNTPEVLANTKVLLVPVTGGISQKKMMEAYPLGVRFTGVESPILTQAIDFLIKEHDDGKTLVQAEDIYRYQTTRMGTTAVGALMQPVFDAVKTDMLDLYNQGLLNNGEYEFVYLSDGKVSPVNEQFKTVLNTFHQCTSCADNYKNCSSVCSLLAQKMEDAWGLPELNSDENIDFGIGLLQALPYYYGAGYMRINLMQLKKDRFLALNPGETSVFDRLPPLAVARGAKISVWQANDDKPSYFPVGTVKGGTSFKMTHLFLLNPNARVDNNGALRSDSDADGVFDSEEEALGTQPSLSRNNGYCLDGFMANFTFAARCNAMAVSHSCDSTLDSDGDSLNECEESLLGTNPFDFDSDGDAIPDYLEWLYGFNPLVSDSIMDSNGDGQPNVINFSYGLSPNVTLANVPSHLKPNYQVNYMGREQITDRLFGQIWVELSQVILNAIPLSNTVAAVEAAQGKLFSARATIDPKFQNRILISNPQQLISLSGRGGANQVLGIARIIDVDDPRRAYWRIQKWSIFVNSQILDPNLDLSNFRQMRVMDEN